MKLLLYQTLDDKENPDHIEQHGPFSCRRENAWLGDGFYFWDAHVQLAHWWGEMNYEKKIYKDGYVICQANAVKDETCWDLYGDGLARIEFKMICDLLVDTKLATYKNLLINQVIEHCKKRLKFKYKAIRALGMNTIDPHKHSKYILRIAFNRNRKDQVLDMYPPIQICLIEKSALTLRNYRIIYPPDYMDNFA